jgi:hypothetical protein
MKSFKLVGALIGALIVIGALAGNALAGAAKAGKTAARTVVHFPAHGPGGEKSGKCFWGTSYTQETWNKIWPNSATNYETSIDTIPAGGKIVFHGQFPHARFFSFTTSSVIGVIRGHLYDDQIKPDPGSTNPYLPGANRNATHRSFTVTMVDAPDPGPGHEAPNTVYGGIAGQAPGAGAMLLVVRVYLPDRGRDFTGGVGVSNASYVAANGATSTGAAACTALTSKPGWANLVNVNPILFPESRVKSLLALSSSPEHPAVKQAVWYKYFNPQWMLAPFYAGTSDANLISSLPVTGTGLGANPANGFAMTWLDRRFGPNHHGHNIAVLHGKLPTTPATYAGEAKMQSGTQLRYWSLCNSQGLTSGATTGACLSDEEVPINAQREYTIVLSLPQDRPKNATVKCGVAWINYGTAGDGYTRPDSTLLILRNLATTAHPAFPNAIQNIATPADVKSTMGPYQPTVSYTDAAKFKHTGCTASAR